MAQTQIILEHNSKSQHTIHSSCYLFHHFVPIAIDTSGVVGSEAITFFKELGQRTKSETRDPRSFHFLIQRAAVAIQRGNAAAVLGTLPA